MTLKVIDAGSVGPVSASPEVIEGSKATAFDVLGVALKDMEAAPVVLV